MGKKDKIKVKIRQVPKIDNEINTTDENGSFVAANPKNAPPITSKFYPASKESKSTIIGVIFTAITALAAIAALFSSEVFSQSIKVKSDATLSQAPNIEVRIFEQDDSWDISYYGSSLIDFYITNKSEFDIYLSDFTLTAENVIMIEKPIIFVDSYINDNAVYADVINDGWGDASDIRVILGGFEELAFDFPNRGQLVTECKTVKPGQKETFLLFSLKEIESEVLRPYLLYPHVTYAYKENRTYSYVDIAFDTIKISEDGINIGTFFNSSSSAEPITYGIKLITENIKSKYRYKPNQLISANSTLYLPIYITADQSCSASLSLEYTINGNYSYKWDNKNSIQLTIPSYYNDSSLIDERLKNKESAKLPYFSLNNENNNEYPNQTEASFPYNEVDIIINSESSKR